MSHTPLDGGQDAQDYALGWRATWRLVREGKSWSGGERDTCFLNLGDGTFADVSSAAGFDSPGDGRALATVDWDRDGDLDLWLTQRDAPRVRFYENRRDPEARSVELRLQARGKNPRANPRAIGARVELVLAGQAARPLVREVVAGSGYLAQSSAWLHFGLGRAGAIERVSVRWPDGTREEFSGVTPSARGARFVLEQGTGRAAPAAANAPASVQLASLKAGKVEPHPVPRRVQPLGRLPLAGLPWTDAEGAARELGAEPGGAAIVTLWTTTCPTCKAELADLAQAAAEFQAAKVPVLALNVEQDLKPGPARAALEALRWPHAQGSAGLGFLDGLAVALEDLLDRPGELAVPTTLVLDRNARLVALHRGRVSVEALLAEARVARGSDAPVLPELPYAGRWIEEPKGERDLLGLAQRLEARGHARIAERIQSGLRVSPESVAGASAKDKREYVDAALELARRQAAEGRFVEAADNLRRALQVDGKRADVQLALAGALRRLGQHEDAAQVLAEARGAHGGESGEWLAEAGNLALAMGQGSQAEAFFASALERDASSWVAALNLGLLRAQRDAHAEARPVLERAATLRPEDANTQSALGRTLFALGEHPAAIEAYQRALARTPADAALRYNLGLAACLAGRVPLAQEQAGELERLDAKLAAQLRQRIASLPR